MAGNFFLTFIFFNKQ